MPGLTLVVAAPSWAAATHSRAPAAVTGAGSRAFSNAQSRSSEDGDLCRVAEPSFTKQSDEIC